MFFYPPCSFKTETQTQLTCKCECCQRKEDRPHHFSLHHWSIQIQLCIVYFLDALLVRCWEHRLCVCMCLCLAILSVSRLFFFYKCSHLHKQLWQHTFILSESLGMKLAQPLKGGKVSCCLCRWEKATVLSDVSYPSVEAEEAIGNMMGSVRSPPSLNYQSAPQFRWACHWLLTSSEADEKTNSTSPTG